MTPIIPVTARIAEVPGVKKIHDACKLLHDAAIELRAARFDVAAEVLGETCKVLGSWIAKITIEHAKRRAA